MVKLHRDGGNEEDAAAPVTPVAATSSEPLVARTPPAGRTVGRPTAHDVFISYSNRDAVTANAVCAALEAGGIRCWIAPRDVSVGRSWKANVVEAIHAARAVVLVFSGEANSSAQVTREVDIAFESKPPIPIFPFRIEDVRMSDELSYCIGDKHWLDALTPPLEPHTERLILALRAAGYTSEADRPSAEAEASLPLPPPSVTGEVSPVVTEVATLPPSPGTTAAHPIVSEPAEPSRGPSRPGKRTLLAALALLVTAAVALGFYASGGGRPSGVARESGAPPGPVARVDTAPVSSPIAAVPPVVSPVPADTQPSRLDSSGGVIVRPDPPAPRATPGAGQTATRLPARAPKDSVRGTARIPDSLSVECARLLERVSLGEVLSAQESTRLKRYCRGAPM